MTNHFHLLLQVRECPLSAIMHRIQTRYSRHFNKNRVRAGLVTKPEDWRWSSQAAYLEPRCRGIADTALVLSLMGLDLIGDPEHSSSLQEPDQPDHGAAALQALAESIAERGSIATAVLCGPSRLHAVSAVRKKLIREALANGFGPGLMGAETRLPESPKGRWAGNTKCKIYNARHAKDPALAGRGSEACPRPCRGPPRAGH